MAANPEHQRLIDRLGRLCGIAPRYWDNFGVYRLTSEATYQALLTAMGVPWEDPAAAAREIQARRQLPWKELLPPVTMVFEDDPAPRIILALTSPEMEVPPGLLIQGEFREEGESWR